MHTPGPWRVCERDACWAIQPETGKAPGNHNEVVYVAKPNPFDATAGSVTSQGRTPDECHANARLIAAAPELLEALDRLAFAALARDATMGDPCNLIAARDELCAAARVVIAKATG